MAAGIWRPRPRHRRLADNPGVAEALSEVDWDEIGKAVEQSMKSLENVDREEMSERIERRMEELDRHLEEQREKDQSN